MTGSLQRFTIDSRTVLRVYASIVFFAGAWLTLMSSVTLSQAGLRAGSGTHAVLLGAFHLVPWVMMAVGVLAGSMAQLEDPLLRRRCLAALVVAHAIVAVEPLLSAMGVTTLLRVPLDGLFPYSGLMGAPTISLLIWSPWRPYAGLGPRVDARLTRWFGPPSSESDTDRIAHDKAIRAAASQEERLRLARDLHDSVKQEIFAIHTSTATAQARFESDPEGARRALEQIRTSARDAMTEMEAMLDRLHARPLETTGFVAAIRRQCEALGHRTGARVTCDLRDLPADKALAPGAYEALLRVAQEALSNIARHARASQVDVTVAIERHHLALTIHDNGSGFDLNAPSIRQGMGLANIRARARDVRGFLTITSSPGHGATIAVRLLVTYVAGNVWRDHPRLKWAIVAVLLPIPLTVAWLLWEQSQESLANMAIEIAVYVCFAALIFARYRYDRQRSRRGREDDTPR